MAVASDNKGNATVRIVDTTNGAELVSFTEHTGAVHSLQFAADNRTLISASADKTVKVWDPETGKEQFSGAGHKDVVYAVAISSLRHLASAGQDRTVRLWAPGVVIPQP